MKTQRVTCDFLVAGAGISGICAAIQAGRLGLKTVLVEKEMILGGNGGPNLGVGAHAAMSTNPYYNEMGIIEEIEEQVNFQKARLFPTNFGYNIHPQWDDVVTRLLEDAGVCIYRRHLIEGATVSGGKIKTVKAVNIENLDRVYFRISGFVMDCTGDAIVADLAGAKTKMGRESKNETGERSAPEHGDAIISTASVTALVVDSGIPCSFVPPPGTPPWNPAKPDNHFNPNQRIHFLWQVDEGGESEENHSLYTPQELYRRLVYRIFSCWNYLKNVKFPDAAKNHQLIWISPILGKRESRRIEGDYLLTQTDIEQCRVFDDAIAFGGSFLDEHLPSFDGGYEVRFYSRPLPYDVPYRCIYSRNIDNLFSGGRAIGVSHLAFTSTRLMRTGGSLAQAAAVAAHLCLVYGCTPRELGQKHLSELKQKLAENDGYLIDYQMDPDKNLLSTAKITASSYAVLSRSESQGAWLSAEQGAYMLIYQYQEPIRQFSVFIRNRGGETSVKGILGYGETSDPVYLPVPEFVFNQKTGRYEETGKSAERILSIPEGMTQPTGSAGCQDYYLRDDTITDFQRLFEQTVDVAEGYTGFITFDVPCGITFPGSTRQKWGQAVFTGICGPVEVLTAPHAVDVVESLIGTDISHENIPIIRISPEIAPGNPQHIADGYIHRQGRAHLHQWMSDPDEPLPQWIECDFGRVITFCEIKLRFDVTERLWKDMYLIKGQQAADRLVKAFHVVIWQNGQWQLLSKFVQNALRFVSIKYSEPVITDKIRIIVDETWGQHQSARIYSVEIN